MADEDSNQTSAKPLKDVISSADEDLVICETGSRSPKRCKRSVDSITVKSEPAEDAAEVSVDAIKITVKSTKEKREVSVKKDSSINELKEEVSKIFKIPTDQVCVIFSGKILKDNETLSSNNVPVFAIDTPDCANPNTIPAMETDASTSVDTPRIKKFVTKMCQSPAFAKAAEALHEHAKLRRTAIEAGRKRAMQQKQEEHDLMKKRIKNEIKQSQEEHEIRMKALQAKLLYYQNLKK